MQIPRLARNDNSSEASSVGNSALPFPDGLLRGLAWVVLAFVLTLADRTGWATSLASPQTPEAQAPAGTQSPAEPEALSAASFGTITPYLGLAIDQIELPGVPPEEAASLLSTPSLKVGAPLTRDSLHDAMQSLYATGRFADIQAEVNRTDTAGIRLRFLTVANFFVGMLTIEGVSSNPSANQLASSTRLQLGELYSREKLDRGPLRRPHQTRRG